eukprot:scaffold66079_cov60-Phaeocystis_antarctica.AAC.11
MRLNCSALFTRLKERVELSVAQRCNGLPLAALTIQLQQPHPASADVPVEHFGQADRLHRVLDGPLVEALILEASRVGRCVWHVGELQRLARCATDGPVQHDD